MKLTDRLIGDHKTFRKMLADIEAIYGQPPVERDPRRLLRTVELFKDHLLLHAWFEDRFYYPAVLKDIDRFAGGPVTTAYMNHLGHEHKTIDGYLDRLEAEVKGNPVTATWPQTFALFARGLSSHMRQEEEVLFPASEKALGADRLEALSQEIERQRPAAPKIRVHTRLEA